MKPSLTLSFVPRSPFTFLVFRTAVALLVAGLVVLVIQRSIPTRIKSIRDAKIQHQTVLAQIQATAELKRDAKVLTPLIPRIEAIVPTDEQAFQVTSSIRAAVQEAIGSQAQVNVGQPFAAADISGLRAVPISIEAQGTVASVHAVISRLAGLPTVIRVSSVSIAAAGDIQSGTVQLRMSAEFFLR